MKNKFAKKSSLKKRTVAVTVTGVMILGMMSGCGTEKKESKNVALDPDNPVSLTVWHYYNGAQQAAFDELVSEFNATVGTEKGIYVEGFSKGSVNDLEQAISASAAGDVGAEDMPDIFSTYADTAYAVEEQEQLVDLTEYFTKDELSEYVDSYISEGYINDDGALYVFPVAKSTEIMMINYTDWEPFAQATGTTLDELQTVEGVVEVAEKYYNWTDEQTPDIPDDGKAFYGRDSMSNYFIIGMKQMGVNIFDVENGEFKLNADKDDIRRLWDNYYVPYVKGYFTALGKFRSDDVKTGDLIAYTGSSSSAMYFPDKVETDEESRDIDFKILTPPVMEGGKNINVQQGAGMAVTKSDENHEYAASLFLKWFTEKENNLRFVCDSAYLPVRKDANTVAALDSVISDNNIDISDKAYDCLTSVMNEFDNTSFYTPKCFKNGYSTRKILDYDLSDKAVADKEAIDAEVAKGVSRNEAVASYITDEAFEEWYNSFCQKIEDASQGK